MAEERVQRKLTTILAADVEGYSRLMSADEETTLKTLKTYREIIDGLIDRHDGRIFGTAGDSVVAEFGSTVEAVRCAMSIQEELRVRNAELVEDLRMTGYSLNEAMGWERNHFDRAIHFSYGLLLAYPIREIFLRIANVRGFWGYFLPLDLTMSTSMMFELFEWGAAELFGGDLGMAYLGTRAMSGTPTRIWPWPVSVRP